jgi:hypothetical protein
MPPALKAPESLGAPIALSVASVSSPQVIRACTFEKIFHASSPPLFDLKSSFLI